ncbi:hypothetical protein [Flavobacterium sp.]|uniref:hypothetical protein n=1 Tax=Flavobacterium sp. TaxID=239 RepID=UPI0037522BB5
MKYLKFVFFVVIITFFTSCIKKPKEYIPTNKLEKLKKNDSLMNSIIDLRIHFDKMYKDFDSSKEFQKFISVATIDDLIYLTDCDIPLVRCFAFKGLLVKEYPKIKEIVLKHSNDVEIIKRQYYDIEITTNVFDYMLNELHPMAKTKFKLSRKEYDNYLLCKKK